MDSDINPYEPPRVDTAPNSLPEINGVTATCIARGWISRTIQLSGNVDAEVRYEGAGFGERVYVDGALVARTPFFRISSDNVTPHIDFVIPTTGQSIPAAIDISAQTIHLLRISRFSLTLYDEVVYAE